MIEQDGYNKIKERWSIQGITHCPPPPKKIKIRKVRILFDNSLDAFICSVFTSKNVILFLFLLISSFTASIQFAMGEYTSPFSVGFKRVVRK